MTQRQKNIVVSTVVPSPERVINRTFIPLHNNRNTKTNHPGIYPLDQWLMISFMLIKSCNSLTTAQKVITAWYGKRKSKQLKMKERKRYYRKKHELSLSHLHMVKPWNNKLPQYTSTWMKHEEMMQWGWDRLQNVSNSIEHKRKKQTWCERSSGYKMLLMVSALCLLTTALM